MNTIGIAKIEACLELCDGGTPFKKAEDFKDKVFKVTGLTEQGFTKLGCTEVSFKMLREGKTVKEILDAWFHVKQAPHRRGFSTCRFYIRMCLNCV